MAKVLMYSTAVCPYCVRAEQLLLRKGVKDIEKMRVDLQPELREEMTQKTGRRTVPQIYIGTTYVGGFDELFSLDQGTNFLRLISGDPSDTIFCSRN